MARNIIDYTQSNGLRQAQPPGYTQPLVAEPVEAQENKALYKEPSLPYDAIQTRVAIRPVCDARRYE